MLEASSKYSLQVEKLFDVACTLIDVMSCVPLSPSSYEMGPREYLTRFMDLIGSLRGGQARYLPLLQSKIAEVLPSYQLPLHPSLPSSSRLDVYGQPSASASAAASNEDSPYESPSPLGLRQNMPMHYPESMHSSMMGASANYPTFSTALAYPETSTTATMGGQGLYQAHDPSQPGYPSQFGSDTDSKG
jgi:hypothetical protein